MLARWIAAKRHEKHYSRLRLAKEIGVDAKTIKRWECGKNEPYPIYRIRLQSLFGSIPDSPEKEVSSMNPNQKMPTESGSTYFIQDRSNQEELFRLRDQDHMFTGQIGLLPEQSDPGEFKRILDVACGTGGWLVKIATKFPTIQTMIGIDISKIMIEFAREQAERAVLSHRIGYQVMDALQTLQFGNNSFDLINLRFAMSFVRQWDWLPMLKEFRRVGRPGGVIRLTDVNLMQSNSHALDQLWAMGAVVAKEMGYTFGESTTSFPSQFPGLLQQIGCESIQTTQHELPFQGGTPNGQALRKDMERLFKGIKPFLERHLKLPENYDEIYQQMLSDLEQDSFQATWPISTTWGIIPLTS